MPRVIEKLPTSGTLSILGFFNHLNVLEFWAPYHHKAMFAMWESPVSSSIRVQPNADPVSSKPCVEVDWSISDNESVTGKSTLCVEMISSNF